MAPVLAENGGGGRAAAREREKTFRGGARQGGGAARRVHRSPVRLAHPRPRLRLGQFPLSRPAGGQGHRIPRDSRMRNARPRHVVPRVGPEILHGIEINPFAAELARTTIWIGDIQWRVRNAITHHPRPILRKLDSIECRDALLTADGKGGFEEAEWPEADCIIGNPPFLGTKKLVGGLGEDEADVLRHVYAGRLSPFSDLVCWWFEKARAQIVSNHAKSAGLVSTNSIRGGRNRLVLDAIQRDTPIFEAWADEPWVVDGAAVRVSIVCFGAHRSGASRLNGELRNSDQFRFDWRQQPHTRSTASRKRLRELRWCPEDWSIRCSG